MRQLVGNARVELVRLARGRLWPWHTAALYQGNFDAIFYPGMEWQDEFGLKYAAVAESEGSRYCHYLKVWLEMRAGSAT